MCGVLGYYCFGDTRPNYDNIFKMWEESKERGTDGCGITFPLANGNIAMVRSEMSSPDFIKSEDGKKILEKFKAEAPPYAMFHTRKTTFIGKTQAIHAHPFTGTDKKVVVVHNGNVKNADTLAREYKRPVPEIDSEVIPNMLEEFKLWEDQDNFRKVLEKFRGEFTICAITKENDSLYLATNKGRPLEMMFEKESDIFYFCSELKFMYHHFVETVRYECEHHGLKFYQEYTSFIDDGDPYYWKCTDRKWFRISKKDGIVSGVFNDPPIETTTYARTTTPPTREKVYTSTTAIPGAGSFDVFDKIDSFIKTFIEKVS